MPTMPSIPSRKLTRLWSSNNGAGKSPPMPNSELASGDDNADSIDDDNSRSSTSNALNVRQVSQEKESQDKEKEKGGGTLAKDIEMRRQTNERLYSAAEAYWSSFSKKKSLPFDMSASSALEIAMILDEAKADCFTKYSASSALVSQAAEEGSISVANHKEKVLPIDGLGLAMASCAHTYIRCESENAQEAIQLKKNEIYASHLSHLSAVHLALGQLQTEYTSSLSSTLLNRLARSQAAIEALKTTEKTAEVAKEKMEAAEKKKDKARDKGEKIKRETEVEARMARATYEEAVADLEARADMLRDSEQRGPTSGVAVLKEYMDVHLAWVEAQHDVLSKARMALDQYPSGHMSSPQISRPIPAKSSAAPPPPPAPSQPAMRRIVEPPLPPREPSRNRSSSSPKIPRPSLPSRVSIGPSITKTSTATDDKAQAEIPPTRSGLAGRIPFLRSESYTASTTPTDASGSENASKAESISKRSRLHSIGASLARSSSSLALPTSDASKMTGNTSLSGTDYTGSDKGGGGSGGGSGGGNWATNLLGRKKEGPYKPMSGEEREAIMSNHDRSLSHVKEASTESRGIVDDQDDDIVLTNGFQHQSNQIIPSISTTWRQHTDGTASMAGPADHEHDHDDILVNDPQSPSLLKPWERFEIRRDSLGIGLHMTGNTASSSEGGDPFGHDSSELSPMGTGTGTGFSPLPRKNRIGSIGEPWQQQDDAGEDDPADGLLGERGGNETIRRSSKR